jgi:hypothetical protein
MLQASDQQQRLIVELHAVRARSLEDLATDLVEGTIGKVDDHAPARASGTSSTAVSRRTSGRSDLSCGERAKETAERALGGRHYRGL